jgi:hypothetical protein
VLIVLHLFRLALDGSRLLSSYFCHNLMNGEVEDKSPISLLTNSVNDNPKNALSLPPYVYWREPKR